ncbi:MAG TPA: HNH endonuclease signature motif containing protein [Candidatus Krumholzibacteria bacterium]|nr:HNH endonuclease signature motif containing protein [Candidatus Krumholzibacteria bacterium]
MLLHSLSDDQIVSRAHRLTRRERTATLLLLLHLIEIERRKLHLSLGYSSMFAFCTRCLGHSESDAGRRIQAARCIARFPEVYGLLQSSAVTVVTISRVASILTEENREDLLRRVQGRTQDEVDAIVAEYRPRAVEPRDRVEVVACRPTPKPQEAPLLAVAVNPEATRSTSRTAPSSAPCETRSNSHDGSERSNPADSRMKFSFMAGRGFKAKFDRVRSLASHRLPANASYEDVFELLMDAFLDREDPAKRRERREKRTQVPGQGRGTPKAGGAPANARRIPAAVRDEIFGRDQGCCTFVGSDGRRCGSTHMLQVDHIRPFALGGPSTLDNLRLLCAYHNRFEAERMMGERGSGEKGPRAAGC